MPVPGQKYRHFKGRTYEVVLVGRDSTTQDVVVIYRDAETADVWVRSADEFCDDHSSGVKRFVLL